MATQEPDRGTRRRWFRLPGTQSDPKTPPRDEPEGHVAIEPAPADPIPAGATDLEDGGVGARRAVELEADREAAGRKAGGDSESGEAGA